MRRRQSPSSMRRCPPLRQPNNVAPGGATPALRPSRPLRSAHACPAIQQHCCPHTCGRAGHRHHPHRCSASRTGLPLLHRSDTPCALLGPPRVLPAGLRPRPAAGGRVAADAAVSGRRALPGDLCLPRDRGAGAHRVPGCAARHPVRRAAAAGDHGQHHSAGARGGCHAHHLHRPNVDPRGSRCHRTDRLHASAARGWRSPRPPSQIANGIQADCDRVAGSASFSNRR